MKFWRRKGNRKSESEIDPAGKREFIAEALEARILYSAAPAPVEGIEQTEVVQESPETGQSFDSIDNFEMDQTRISISPVEKNSASETLPVDDLQVYLLNPEELDELIVEAAGTDCGDGVAAITGLSIGGAELGYSPDSQVLISSAECGLAMLQDSIPADGVSFSDQTGLDESALESTISGTVEIENMPLTLDTLEWMAEAAEQHWSEAGLTGEQIQALDSVEYHIADLEGSVLGYADGSHIYIDDDAAQLGWFIDETPLDLSETGFSGVDLVSVLVHEQGHVLGLEDQYLEASADVMNGIFAEGERRDIAEGRADGADPLSLAGPHFATTEIAGAGQPLDTRQPYATTNYAIALQGTFPSPQNLSGGGDPVLGSIMQFAGNFAPRGWALAEGQILQISQHYALFSILGTTYGGDGETTFALPDLRGRVPVGIGTGPDLSSVALGQTIGSEQISLSTSELPGHDHDLGSGSTDDTGLGQSFDNRMPGLGLRPLIAVSGTYPSRNAEAGLGSVYWFAGNFDPAGYHIADGSLLSMSQNPALFSLLGTTYGGDGQTTFRLPDLQGRTPIHSGSGPGLSDVTWGEQGGSETVTLEEVNLPPHSHTIDDGDQNTVDLPTEDTGSGHPIDLRSPYLALTYEIALSGLYPSSSIDADETPVETEDTGFRSGKDFIDIDTAGQLIQSLAEEGIQRWAEAGIDAGQISQLQSINFTIEDLDRGVLASVTGPDSVTIDINAAGRGWFVDLSGTDDAFDLTDPLTGELYTNDGEAARYYDLLTTIMHEQGHILGLSHPGQRGSVMSGVLSIGGRFNPEATDLSFTEHEEETDSPDLIGGEPFIAQIGMFAGNFASRGFAETSGQLLPISSNVALFSLLGTMYGGDGLSTFGLPDFRGRAVVGAGTGPELSPYSLGQIGGRESAQLSVAQMPAHSHELSSGTGLTIDGEGNLVITDNDGTADNLTLSSDGAFLTIKDNQGGTIDIGDLEGSGNGTAQVEIALSKFSGGIIFNGAGGDDTFEIDFTNGSDFGNRAITINGEGQNSSNPGDQLVLTGGTFTDATFNFDNANDGNINLDGLLVNYTGLEPITSTSAAENVTLTFNGGDETIDVTDNGATITVDSTAGESLTFAEPAGSLTIDAGTGTDVINFPNAFSMAADLIVTGETINLDGGSVSTTESDQEYNGAVVLSADTTITGNDVIFNGAVDSDSSVDASIPIGSALNNLEINHSLINSLIPSRYDFSDGFIGTTINDGGSDMYDGGNRLNTNLATDISYTNNITTAGASASAFGAGSEYFTAKYDGIFTMVAKDISIDYFEITGNNGADGGGAVNGAVLATSVGAQRYTIFLKRVYDAGDPSINHIIVVPGDGSGQSHNFATSTDNDQHRVIGLAEVDEIYYALVARSGGQFLADGDVIDIANALIEEVTPESVPWSLTVNTTDGGVTAFNGVVGGNSFLSVSTNNDGRTEIASDLELKGNNSSFGDSVLVKGDVTIRSYSDLSFESTVDSASGNSFDLSVLAGSRNVEFLGDVGTGNLGTLSEGAGLGGLSLKGSISTNSNTLAIKASDFQLSGTFDAGAGTLHIIPHDGDIVKLGLETEILELPGGLEISRQEGERITASTLKIGNESSGTIWVDHFELPNVTTLQLQTAGAVLEYDPDSGRDIEVTNLAINAAMGIGDSAASFDLDAYLQSAAVAPNIFTTLVSSATTQPVVNIGSIPGEVGKSILVTAVGIGGDSTSGSGDNRFVLSGGGLDFSWVAGQQSTPADLRIPGTPIVSNGPDSSARGFSVGSPFLVAEQGAALELSWDYHSDYDGLYTYGTDPLGNFYDDSGTSSSIRPIVQYAYVTDSEIEQIRAGVSSTALELHVSNLEADGGSGGVYVENYGALTLGGVSSSNGVSASGGNIEVTATTLYVNEDVLLTGGGEVFLEAAGSLGSIVNNDTDLLDAANLAELEGWLGEPFTLENIFERNSGDAATATDFHSKADGQGPTISVFEVVGPNGTELIGGYNPQSWDSFSGYNADNTNDAFIFNLTTGLKLDNTDSRYHTFNSINYGPTFGGGHDLYSNSALTSGYASPHSYNPSGVNIFGVSVRSNFTINAVEVFTINEGSPPSPATLTVDAGISAEEGTVNLTATDIEFEDGGAFSPGLRTPTDFDQFIINGELTIKSGAELNPAIDPGIMGGNFEIVLFANDEEEEIGGFLTQGGVTLNEGDLVTVGSETFSISYVGGDGNDIVLTPGTTTTVTINTDGDLVITDSDGEDTADDLTISAYGENLYISDSNPDNKIDLGDITGTGDGTNSVSIALDHDGWNGNIIINTLGSDDKVNLGAATGLNGSVTINTGSGTDEVNVIGDFDAGAGNILIGSESDNVESINFAGGKLISTGDITIYGDVTLKADARVEGNNITFGGNIDLGGFDLTIVVGGDATIAGSIRGSDDDRLLKEGSGTLTLTQESASYSGTTVLNSGKLSIQTAEVDGVSQVLGTGNLILNGGILDLHADVSTDFGVAVAVTDDTTVIGGALPETIDAAAITFDFASLSIDAHQLTIQRGEGFSDNASYASFDFNQVTLTGNATFHVVDTTSGRNNRAQLFVRGMDDGSGDSFGFSKTGRGFMIMGNGMYRYKSASLSKGELRVVSNDGLQGVTNVSGGTLNLRTRPDAARQSDLVFSDDSNLTLSRNAEATTFTAKSIEIESGVVLKITSSRQNSTFTVEGVNTLVTTGAFITGAGATIQSNQASTVPFDTVISSDITMEGDLIFDTLTQGTSGPTELTVTGKIDDGDGTFSITKTGTGFLTLSGANTFGGDTSIDEGTMILGGGGALGATSAVSVANGATLEIHDVSSSTINDAATLEVLGTGLVRLDQDEEVGGLKGDGTVRAQDLDSSGAATVTLTVGSGDATASFSGLLTDGDQTLAFAKAGTGVQTLAGNNTYSGTTLVSEGTLAVGIDDALPVTTDLTVGEDSDTTTAHLDLNGFSQTVGSLSVYGNNATPNTITVDTGDALTVSGDFVVGLPASAGATTNLTGLGGGSLIVNGDLVEIGIASTDTGIINTTAVDLTALGTFTADVTDFRVANAQRNAATLLLSDVANAITTGVLSVSDSVGNNSAAGVMVLGAGTNVINADSIDIGLGKGNGTIKFASQMSVTPNALIIRDQLGTGAANLTVGENTSAGTSATTTGILDLRGHDVDVEVASMTIAHRDKSGTSETNGGVAGTVSFDTGTFTVDSIDMAIRSGNFGNPATATLNIGGGTFTVNDSFSMANKTDDNTADAVARVNLTGGVLVTNADITQSGPEADINTLIYIPGNTADGRLELQNDVDVQVPIQIGGRQGATFAADHIRNVSGNNTISGDINGIMGGGAYNISSVAGTLTISGTVHNPNSGTRVLHLGGVGDGEISGDLTGSWFVEKEDGGTWEFSGTNTNTGTTTVEAGTLLINGTHIGGGSYTVDANATLGGTGTITLADDAKTVTINGTLATGDPDTADGIGDLTINNDVIFNGIYNFQIDGSTSDTLVVGDGDTDGGDDETVTLGAGSTLTVTDINNDATDNSTIVMIDNDGADAIIGTFGDDGNVAGTSELTEGTTVVDDDGDIYVITYAYEAGADGNANDVALFEGAPETQVDFDSGTGVLSITDINSDSVNDITVTFDATGNGGTGTYTISESDADNVIGTSGVTVISRTATSVTIDATGISSIVIDTDGAVDADDTPENNDTVSFAAGDAVVLSGALTVIADDIVVEAGAKINSSGAGSVNFNANTQIDVLAGAEVTSDSGAITMSANAAGTGNGNFIGIDISGATVSSNSGPIALTGTGSNNDGIQIDDGTEISSTSGTITLTGTGGATANDEGVVVAGAGTKVTSETGNITITGTNNDTDDGVQVSGGAEISSTGTDISTAATITITGTGGDGAADGEGSGDRGVEIVGGATVTSAAGGISITGTGAGDDGVYIAGGATVSSTGTLSNAATIMIDGTGSGIANSEGVNITGAGTTVTSVDGDISISGDTDSVATGLDGNGGDDDGVQISVGALISSTGTDVSNAAKITITGDGGAIGGDRGVEINSAGTKVTSHAGAILIKGTSAGDGGVFVGGGAEVSSTGNGANAATITLDGEGGATSNDEGVEITGAGTLVTSIDGNILIDGDSGGADDGVDINSEAVVSSTGTTTDAATITIIGAGGNGEADRGVEIADDALVTSIIGTISITGTSSGDGVGIEDRGTVSSTGIGVNAATITVNGTSSGGNEDDGVAIGDSDQTTATTGGTITSVDGNIIITGTSSGDDGVSIDDGGVISSTGTGANAANISITGNGGGNSGLDDGVIIKGADSSVSSVDGDINIEGTGGEDGVEMEAGVTAPVSATGDGNIRICGTSTNPDNAGGNFDVQIDAPVASHTGTVEICSIGSGSVSFGADGDVTSTSEKITVRGADQVIMANGSLINAGSGDIDVDANGDITIGGLKTTGAGSVTVDTTNPYRHSCCQCGRRGTQRFKWSCRKRWNYR
ncbi:MAG: PEP_CTERM-anchored TLD domain-containing protein [Verrucomicrobiales bacterium]|nr:PEP_CTERM-anchored TLD domain-containing protein [Verrucomicrobiales bacterium]